MLNFNPIENIFKLLPFMEACALFALALSGFIEARKKRLDTASTFIVGFASAFGGGTIRDILLDRRPFYWVQHENYAILVFILSLIAPLVIKISSRIINQTLFVTIEAIGLGLFAISGTSIAISLGIPYFTSTLLGVISGAFGGIVRDILLNQMPSVLKDNRLYITCAFIGAWIYIILKHTQISEINCLLISSFSIFCLRMIAWKLNLRLPK